MLIGKKDASLVDAERELLIRNQEDFKADQSRRYEGFRTCQDIRIAPGKYATSKNYIS